METNKRQFISNYLITIFAFLFFGLVILFGYDYFSSIQNRNRENVLKINKAEISKKTDLKCSNGNFYDSISEKQVDEYTLKKYIDNCVNNNFSSGLIKVGFLVLGIFTLIFTALTILINSFSTKTQNTLAEIRIYEDKIIKLFNEANDIKEKIYNDQIPELKFKYENYLRILFVTLNGYLKDEYQLDSLSLLQILKLFGSDLTEVQEAAMLLSKSKEKKCIPFLKEIYKYYDKLHNGTTETNQKQLYSNILIYIDDAIKELQK